MSVITGKQRMYRYCMYVCIYLYNLQMQTNELSISDEEAREQTLFLECFLTFYSFLKLCIKWLTTCQDLMPLIKQGNFNKIGTKNKSKSKSKSKKNGNKNDKTEDIVEDLQLLPEFNHLLMSLLKGFDVNESHDALDAANEYSGDVRGQYIKMFKKYSFIWQYCIFKAFEQGLNPEILTLNAKEISASKYFQLVVKMHGFDYKMNNFQRLKEARSKGYYLNEMRSVINDERTAKVNIVNANVAKAATAARRAQERAQRQRARAAARLARSSST